MDNKWISKIKGSKPFNIMIGITAILTALVTFTDTIEKVSNKFNNWFGDPDPIEKVAVTTLTDTSDASNTATKSDTTEITVVSPLDTASGPSPHINQADASLSNRNPESPIDAFKNYNSKHITPITDFSDAISIAKNKLIMDLSVLSKPLDSNKNAVNEYHINKRGSLYQINPSYGYLKSLERGKLASNNLSTYNFGLPLFDVKTVNNSEESIFITKAIFKIKKSVPDLTPYFKISYGEDFRIPLQNIGYSSATNAKLELSIKDSTGVAKVHEIALGNIERYCRACDVSEILKTYNVNVNLFKGEFSNFPTPEELDQARGAFKTAYVLSSERYKQHIAAVLFFVYTQCSISIKNGCSQ